MDGQEKRSSGFFFGRPQDAPQCGKKGRVWRGLGRLGKRSSFLERRKVRERGHGGPCRSLALGRS